MAQRATRIRGWRAERRDRRRLDELARSYRERRAPRPPLHAQPEIVLAASLTFFVVTMWLVGGR